MKNADQKKKNENQASQEFDDLASLLARTAVFLISWKGKVRKKDMVRFYCLMKQEREILMNSNKAEKR